MYLRTQIALTDWTMLSDRFTQLRLQNGTLRTTLFVYDYV